jgi:putative transposase
MPRTARASVGGLCYAALTDAELTEPHQCAERGRPYGNVAWVEQTAERLGLGFTLRPRGRPRKSVEKS